MCMHWRSPPVNPPRDLIQSQVHPWDFCSHFFSEPVQLACQYLHNQSSRAFSQWPCRARGSHVTMLIGTKTRAKVLTADHVLTCLVVWSSFSVARTPSLWGIHIPPKMHTLRDGVKTIHQLSAFNPWYFVLIAGRGGNNEANKITPKPHLHNLKPRLTIPCHSQAQWWSALHR